MQPKNLEVTFTYTIDGDVNNKPRTEDFELNGSEDEQYIIDSIAFALNEELQAKKSIERIISSQIKLHSVGCEELGKYDYENFDVFLGGKWNKFLSCGPGWIFSKKKLEEVKAALQGNPTPEDPKGPKGPTEEAPTSESNEEPAPFTMSATPKGKPILTLHSIPAGNYEGKSMQLVFVGTWSDGVTDRVAIRYGKKVKFASLHWTGGGVDQVYLQQLNGGSYGDIKLKTSEFAKYLQAIGAVNELRQFNNAVQAWNRQEQEPAQELKQLPAHVPHQTTLRDEIVKTVEFFAEKDVQDTGSVQPQTMHIAHIQRVDLDLFSAPSMHFHHESRKGGANA